MAGTQSDLPSRGQHQGAPLQMDLGQGDQELIAGRTTILYGESGVGKSTNLRFVAQQLYQETGLVTRLISFEDSTKTIFKPLIDLSMVQALFLTKMPDPLVVLRRLSRGDWPVFKADGTIASWTRLRPNEVAGYLIEGLTSGSESLLEELREEHRFLREQKTDAFEIGAEKFAPASQTAFGFVQQEMLRGIKGFGMLPVQRVVWSAHETTGAEEDTKDPIRGPGLVGSKATAKVQKYCGTLLHFEIDKSKGAPKPRIYYRQHPDWKFPNISYPAKTTVPVEMLGELEKMFPGGYFEPGVTYGTGLDKFFSVVDGLVARFTHQELSAWMHEVDAQRKHGA